MLYCSETGAEQLRQGHRNHSVVIISTWVGTADVVLVAEQVFLENDYKPPSVHNFPLDTLRTFFFIRVGVTLVYWTTQSVYHNKT